MQSHTPRQGAMSLLRPNALRAAMLSFIVGLFGSDVQAQDFYANKTIDLHIGYSAGGGYDIYGRTLANHLGRHIPGHPTIVVKNMPGAGSMRLGNYLSAIAPKDGTVLGAVAGGAITAPLFKVKAATYDSRRFTWVGSITSDVALTAAWHTSGIKSINDVFKREFIVGTAGPGSGNHTYPLVLNEILGTKFKLVPGYPGNTEIAVAMERGEIEGVASWHVSGIAQSRPTWLKEQQIFPLLQLSLNKDPTLPDAVPLVIDLGKTPDERLLLTTIFAQQLFSRPILAPPEVPADRVRILQEAFRKTMKDPAFLAEAEKRRIEINEPMDGPAIATLLDKLYATPANVLARAASVIGGQ